MRTDQDVGQGPVRSSFCYERNAPILQKRVVESTPALASNHWRCIPGGEGALRAAHFGKGGLGFLQLGEAAEPSYEDGHALDRTNGALQGSH